MVMLLSVGNVWGADATMSGGTSVTVGGKSAMKVGANKSGGSMTITVGANATSLSFYIAAWSGDNTSVSVTPTANVGTTALSPTQDSGISGSGNSFTLSGTESTYYTTITLSNITAETEITLASSAGKNRFVVWGATYETGGGSTPTVSLDPDGGNFTESVEVTITPSTGATAYYTTDATKKTTPSTTTWTAYNGSTKPTFTETTTIWVAAVKDATWSDVVEKTFTKIIPITSYDIDFETTDFDLYVNWDFTNAEVAANGANTNISAHGGTHYGTTGGKATAAIKTHSKIASPGTLSCYVSKQSDNTTSSTWYIQVSENGTDWTDVESRSATSMTKGNWVEFSADLSAYANVYVRLYYNGGTAIRNVDDISLVMASGIAKPTITGEDNFLTSTEVTISCITDGAAIYYTTTESAKATPATSGDWNAYDNSNKPSFSSTTTVWAAAKLGDDWSAVAEKTFTKATILTVAEALTIIEGLDNKTATTAEYYVSGVVSTVTALTVDGTGEYYISADGTKTSELQVYKGKWVDGANFTSTDQLIEGDDVTIKGKLKKYNDYKELDQNNEVVLYKLKARLAWSEESYEADLSSSNTFPSLTNTNGVSVSYSSSNTDAATINPSTGEISLVAVGQTTITAAFAGNGDYKANSASYTLNVASSVIRADISFEENGGSDVADLTEQSNLPDPLPTITKAGYNFGGWYTDSEFKTPAVAGAAVVSSEAITLYAKWLDPYTVAEALEIIGNLEDGGQTANSVYVAGIVCTAPTSNPSSGKLTFYISANGEESDRLQAYNCKGLNNVNFEAKTDIQVMDELVIYGPLKKYIKNAEVVPEFNTGYLYSFNRPAVQTYSITYVENGANEDIEDVAEATNLPDPLPTVTKNEKIFGGWYTDAEFNTLAVAGAALTGNVTLYAKWNDLSPWASVYTSNVEIESDAAPQVTIGGTNYPAAKANKASTATITLPQGVTTIHLHLVAWSGEGQTVTVSGDCFDTDKNLTIEANAGVSGSGSTYNLGESGVAYYFSLTPDKAVAADDKITITAASGKRFVLFGVNQEGGVVPVLQSLAISGDLENKTYEAGASINPAGLTVMGTYTLGGTPQTPVDVTDQVEDWLYDALQAGDETVTISAKIGTVTSAGYEISGLTVTDPTPRFETNPTSYISFGSKEQGVTITARDLEVTLVNVSNASVEITGTGAAAFSVDEDALTGNATLHVSASSANVGTFAATLTISDEAGVAADKEISLSLTVTAPVVEETAVSTTSEWVVATEVADGMEVLITGVKSDVTYAISEQANNNRTTAAGTLNEEVFTPGANTMSFTLVAQGEGTYALRASNGNYLYAASSSANQLKTRDAIGEDGKAVWTISIGEGNVASIAANCETANWRNVMQFNQNGTNAPVVACYASASQSAIKLYVPKPVKYTVTFDKNDGSATTSVEVIKNEKVAQPENPSRDGYTFNYWTLNAVEYDFDTPVTDNITLVANWTENPAPSTPDYTRNVTNGNYGTICLPKAGTISGAKLFEVAYKGDGLIYVDEILSGAMEAGVPYIFEATSTQLSVTYNDNTDAPVEASHVNGLYGFYNLSNMATDDADKLDLDEDQGNYILYQNQYWLVSGRAAYINNFRAYIKLGEISTTAPTPNPGQAPRRRVAMTVHGEQVATGFENLNASEKPVKLMIDGNIYILRGEKLYDATGRLVK